MFSDPKKPKGIVIGLKKAQHPRGNLIYLTHDFKVRQIHQHELKHQNKQPLVYKQRKSRTKFLAFDKFNGNPVIVFNKMNKYTYEGAALYTSDGKLHISTWTLRELERAPDSFYLSLNCTYETKIP